MAIEHRFASENYVENLYKKLNSNTTLGFYCIEDVTIVTNGISKTYPANSNVEIKFIEDDTFEIIPTSDNSILALNAFPSALGTFYTWLEGVAQFSNILFDMNAEDMYTRWSKVTSFTGLEHLLTNKVTSMKRMFDGLFLLEDISVGHFITKRCTTMECMFNNCELLKEIDVKNWDVSKVTNMYAMFADCTKITKLETSNWRPESCLNANSLCYDCFKLEEIDLSNADWGSATNFGMSFYCCYALPSLELKRSNGKSTNSVWQTVLSTCTSLVKFDASNINTQGVSDLTYFFEGCQNLKEVIWHGLDMSTCTAWYSFFSECSSLEKIDFTGINTAIG